MLRCATLFPWPGNFNPCYVIGSPLRNNYHWVIELNIRDNRKYLQNIKNRLFSWEDTRVVNSIWLKMSFKIFFLLNPQNNYLFSLYQTTSVEIQTASYSLIFIKKNTGVYGSQTNHLNLLVFYDELKDFQ